ncbi:glycoside hydrolase family 13 protein [Dothistroma septosporum NZE10]|uniref:alpha-amylase n=1 Tax=Dothistroma septosporum (strain NZE10 / CBS 128990) TaxID=675120 RepID=N1PUS9_DOTSN|nr:glycoside hydrolase family 13 protein [Dothistroma septosporum NZE10]
MHILNMLSLMGLALYQIALAASGDDWAKWTIYQVMTDRFARTDGSTTATCDTGTGDYCNGTWQGLIAHLDYIQGMGFDAVWISPVTKQLEGLTADGAAYHGYWQTDLNDVNEHFGTASDLQSLSAALHSRGMYLMVDVVTNHFAALGPPDSIDYTTLTPFDSQSYFHPYCSIDYNDVANITQVEQCWEGSQNVPLPDVRTEDSSIASTLDNWISGLVSDYSIDGLRIDSVMEVNPSFWAAFQSSAGVYSLGEVYVDDADFVCSYQDYLPGVFNYAMYYSMTAAFSSTTGSIGDLANMIETIKSCPDTSQLGTFSENHDVPRFASLNGDIVLAQNILTFTMLTDGIPVVYQGQEQHYNAVGGSGSSGSPYPWNREAVWLSGYNTGAELYVLTKQLNAARHVAIANSASYVTTQNENLYQDLHTLAMKKGDVVTIVTNDGSNGSAWTLSVPLAYTANTQVTELLTCDTLTTASDGTLAVPMSGGLPRVYYPTALISSCGDGGATTKRKRAVEFKA